MNEAINETTDEVTSETMNFILSRKAYLRLKYSPQTYDNQWHKIKYTLFTIYRNSRTATAAAQEMGVFLLLLRDEDIIDESKVAIDVEKGKLHIHYKWILGSYNYTFNIRRYFGMSME